jgi:hypothetical protein
MPRPGRRGATRRPLRSAADAGQAAIEYLGVTVASALIVLAIMGGFPEVRTAIVDALDRAACTLTFGDDCEGPADGEPVVPIGAVVDPEAPRPELEEATDATGAVALGEGVETRFADEPLTGAGSETCFASSRGCAKAPQGAILDEGTSACEEGVEVAPGQTLTCRNGLPVLDLDFDGVADHRDPFYTTPEGEELQWYRQERTDFNEDGIADAAQPGAFSYGINRLYRPGVNGVFCELSPDVEDQLNCAPPPEYMANILGQQSLPLGEGLERASVFVPLPGGALLNLARRLGGPLAKAAKPLLESLPSLLRRAPRSGLKALPADVRALATRNITNSGETVIGHFPGYIHKARSRKASYFDVGKRWDDLDDAQRWAANKHFLDEIAAKGDTVLLATPRREIQAGTFTAREVQYLTREKGYRFVNEGTLVPRG